METENPKNKLKRCKPKLLKLDDITILPELQSRENGLNEEVVTEYVERFEPLRGLGPIPGGANEIPYAQAENRYDATGMPRLETVTPDHSTYWLASGFHRFEALERIGCETEIPVEVYEGSMNDAKYISMTANRNHGLRRSNADKRRAVRMALEHEWTYQMSNVAIAELVGVSDRFVATVRRELEDEDERLERESSAQLSGELESTSNGSRLSRKNKKNSEPSNNPFSPPKRMGRDGKYRSAPRRPTESMPDIGADDSTSNGSRLKTTKNRHDSENPFDNENPNMFPKHLLNVPGFIATLSEFINDTSFVKQPVLALASAIAFQAFLCSHCVRDPMGTRPNVNILAVGRTASGKERGRKVIKEILSTLEHRPNRCYGNASKYFAEDVASYQALVQTLQSANGTLIWLWDEVGKVLPSLRADKTSHLSGLLPVIMRLYTSSDSTFVPHRRANAQDNLDPIHQPHLVLYGTSVPRNILEGFSVESLTDGLMGRLMFFEADDDAEDREDEMTKIPAVSEEILEVADWWMTKKASRINPKVPSPDTVPVNEDAAAEFRKLTELKRLARSSGDDVTLALWGRAVEQARQLALIYACSRDREKPTVDRDAASWACETVSYLIRRKIFLAARYVADDDFDRKQKEVIRFVEACKGRCTRTMMTNQFRNWDIRFRKNVFDNLFETEILTQVWKTSGKAGRPTAFVVLKKDR